MRKVRFRRETALWCVFVDSVGEFAGQPREQLFRRYHPDEEQARSAALGIFG
jgi:hypothetical protein